MMARVVASGEVRRVDLHHEVEVRRVLEFKLVHGALRPCGEVAHVAVRGRQICDMRWAEHGCRGGKCHLWHLVLPSSLLDPVGSLPDLAPSMTVVA
jgi:hypothetical protein